MTSANEIRASVVRLRIEAGVLIVLTLGVVFATFFIGVGTGRMAEEAFSVYEGSSAASPGFYGWNRVTDASHEWVLIWAQIAIGLLIALTIQWVRFFLLIRRPKAQAAK